MTTAMLRLREVKRPISEETIAFRIEAAIPNRAGKAFGKNVPSFRGQYFLLQSTDIAEEHLTEDRFGAVLEKVRKDLKWMGYSDSYFVGD